jgi:hypothetical protein
MSAVPQVSLADNERFLQQIGYLATISGGGPFSGTSAALPFVNSKIRQSSDLVKVGDDAYTGNEWGKVIAIAEDSITVEFVHTTKPAGVSNADYNPKRVQVYPISLDNTVSGANEDNAWQKLASIGVLFVYKVVPNPVEETYIALNFVPVFFAGDPAELQFNTPDVTVQMYINDAFSGDPYTTGPANITTTHTMTGVSGDAIHFVVSKIGHNSQTFGPYIVQHHNL